MCRWRPLILVLLSLAAGASAIGGCGGKSTSGGGQHVRAHRSSNPKY